MPELLSLHALKKSRYDAFHQFKIFSSLSLILLYHKLVQIFLTLIFYL